MAKSTTDSCCLTLPLKCEKWQSDRLEKRFEIARQLYNTLLRYELKKLRQLEQTREYRELNQQIHLLYEEKKSDSQEYNLLCNKRDKLRENNNLSKDDFKSDMKLFYKHFSDNIGSSVAVHGISVQVWTAFEKYFHGNGKTFHFKKYDDIKSVRGYSNFPKSGGAEIMFRNLDEGIFIEWKGLKIPVKLGADNIYEREMLNYRVKYCRIVREIGKTKPHFYVQLVLEGKPVIKCSKETGEVLHPVGCGTVGIDIGPQTIAYSSDNECGLLELADKVQKLENVKKVMQQKLDRSRRATNPNNYNKDGTIKRGVKLTHNKSKRYKKIQHDLSYLQHQQAKLRKRQHNELANKLLSLGDTFFIEDMEWGSLAHRAKKTEISEKTGRYKRKKRFGKSIANKAPAMLKSLLDQKLDSRNLPKMNTVDTRVRASQYNHITDDYQKKELSERWNIMPDGKKIQRDLYSAFLLQHINSDMTGFDRQALIDNYDTFVIMHDEVIENLRKTPNRISSMGI